ncbi:MAG: hypothetical protein PHP51_02455 [Desulfotomaculaceae bacterium]|nr:hypothetical protein [Desulfotomaculaceae bacterium]MDD4766376.1 hypothetical protein [Desulfotomaculaceae bacterium]
MKWQLGDEKDNRIIEYDGWLDLDDLSAPDQQGVFVFVCDRLEVKYVGRACASLLDEMKSAISQGKAAGALMCAWYVAASEHAAAGLEKYWLERYQPANN